MLHRHLNHQQWTLAAIDDVMARGKQLDWADLRHAALADRAEDLIIVDTRAGFAS